MKKGVFMLVVLFVFCFLSNNLTSKGESVNPFTALETNLSKSNVQKSSLSNMMDRLPLRFIEIMGQLNQSVLFQLKLSTINVYFTQTEIVYQFFHRVEGKVRVEHMRMKFAGISDRVKVEGRKESQARVNFFIGNDPEKWIRGSRAFGQVVYRDLYPGIDLIVYGKAGKIKHEYLVRAGGNVKNIQITYEGVDGLEINQAGELELMLMKQKIREGTPFSYQVIDGKRVEVKSEYRVTEGDMAGFRVGTYRKDKELIIDPTLYYSTFLGGNTTDSGQGIVLDGAGNAYVTGYTYSYNFPTTVGVYDTTHADDNDVFVTKLNADGSDLIYSTFVGGNDRDYGFGIKIDGAGNAYVTGLTFSTDFPTTVGAYDTTQNGNEDAFILKLNADASDLSYSTFIGGSEEEWCKQIALDGSGNTYIIGYTKSTDFPTTVDAYDTSHNGEWDVFVTKLNSAGSDLSCSTYLGGSSNDFGLGIVIDGDGNIYVTGNTSSSDFPTTAGAYDTTHNGNEDAFVCKFDATGATLSCSTFVGGYSSEDGHGIAIDGDNNIYVSGYTGSPNFPTTAGAYDTTHNGGSDVYVAKLNADASGLSFSTFIGGSGWDYGRAFTIDGSGNSFVAGQTQSVDFPVTSDAFDTTHNGDYDALFFRLDNTGSELSYSTYLGGGSPDESYGIALDTSGHVYIAGWTQSSAFPTTVGAYNETYNGGSDAFIVKFDFTPPDPLPDVKANNSDGPLSITQSDTLQIKVSLECYGLTDNADFWLAYKGPMGWYHFDYSTKQWISGLDVTFQGVLFDQGAKKVFQSKVMAPGNYTFYFGVDMNMDGKVTKSSLYKDEVQVTVTQ